MPFRMNLDIKPFLLFQRRPKGLIISLKRPWINRMISSAFRAYVLAHGYFYRAFTFLKFFLSLFFFLSFNLSLCLAQDFNSYIRDYKDIAIAEMMRTGIPASIKLAQGMVESNCGTSELARKANNHFGIKCGADWTGKSFHIEDDDYKDGELTKSCFREFKTPYESFVAHSDFLTDPKKAARYGPLFQLKTTDYKDWAFGLSKAGYATDPHYADKLIKIIEDNRLYDFDSDVNVLASANLPASRVSTLIRSNNRAQYVIALDGDNIASISGRVDISEKQLLRYNDEAFSKNEILPEGTKIYLEPRRSKFHGKQKYYVLKPGEDLIFVSREFGIKLSALQKRNGIESNQVPAPGQKIMLKGKPSAPLKTKDPYQMPDEVQTPPENNQLVMQDSADTMESTPPVGIETHQAEMKTTQLISNGSGQHDHVVVKGESLYSIAQNFGLSVDELKKINNLSVDTIFIGQKLMLK